MDDESGDDERDGLASEWRGESRQTGLAGETGGMNLEVDFMRE